MRNVIYSRRDAQHLADRAAGIIGAATSYRRTGRQARQPEKRMKQNAVAFRTYLNTNPPSPAPSWINACLLVAPPSVSVDNKFDRDRGCL